MPPFMAIWLQLQLQHARPKSTTMKSWDCQNYFSRTNPPHRPKSTTVECRGPTTTTQRGGMSHCGDGMGTGRAIVPAGCGAPPTSRRAPSRRGGPSRPSHPGPGPAAAARNVVACVIRVRNNQKKKREMAKMGQKGPKVAKNDPKWPNVETET